MKAVIMTAGKGTRMLPLTEKTHKVLLHINGKPFLYYLIKNLQAAGITEFGFVVGYLQEQVREYVKNLNATFIEQLNPKGTGEAVGLAKKFTKDENFIVCGGDNLWSPNDLKTIMKNDNLTYVTAQKVTNPERYGVFVTKEDKVTKVIEKPETFVSNLANTGLYKFTPEIYEKISQLKPSKRGELELTDAIQMLADEDKVRCKVIQDYWIDLGKIEDIPIVEEKITSLLSCQ